MSTLDQELVGSTVVVGSPSVANIPLAKAGFAKFKMPETIPDEIKNYIGADEFKYQIADPINNVLSKSRAGILFIVTLASLFIFLLFFIIGRAIINQPLQFVPGFVLGCLSMVFLVIAVCSLILAAVNLKKTLYRVEDKVAELGGRYGPRGFSFRFDTSKSNPQRAYTLTISAMSHPAVVAPMGAVTAVPAAVPSEPTFIITA